MRAWLLPPGSDGYDKLYCADLPDPEPGPGEVLIAPQAWSINYRDFAVAAGQYFGRAITRPTIPLADGAGEVIAVGDGVTGVAPGNKVQGSMFLDWISGKQVPSRGLGDGVTQGMLAERVVLPAPAVVPIAAGYSYAQAACLPVAGVTAWNALFKGGRPIEAGSKVLVLGTGGVSLTALALARAAGAEVIATSSSPEKLERVRAMGAAHAIDYTAEPAWGAYVRDRFGGADKVIEVGGLGTLQQSIDALASEGEIALVGMLSEGDPPPPRQLMMTGGSIRGIFVGSAAMAGELNAFVAAHGVVPPIGASFGFDDVHAAYAHARSRESFGKTVITL